MDISFTVFSLFVCAVTDFSGDDKASGVKFCTVVHGRPGREAPILGNFATLEAQNRTNRLPPAYMLIYGSPRRRTYLARCGYIV